MYQVIIILDESREKSYYHSYVDSEDTTLGNISCVDLPPYQDISKAHACYWDAENEKWVFDEEKYQEILAEIENEKKEASEKEAIQKTVMTNEEATLAIIELSELVGGLL